MDDRTFEPFLEGTDVPVTVKGIRPVGREFQLFGKAMTLASLLGDLNAARPASELAPVFATYRDVWQEAQRLGAISGVLSGETEIGANHRIDYVLLHRALPLLVKSAAVPKTGSARHVEASDHRPLVATFQVKEPAGDARE